MIEGQGGGGKHKATTTHKSKPDGTKEVSHSVEQTLPDMMRRARKTKAPMSHHSSERAHQAVIHGQQTGSIADTLRMLRDARQQVNMDTAPQADISGAFAGDGTLERPAPLNSLMPEGILEAPAAGGGNTLTPSDPGQAWLLQQLKNRLVPRYKGGAANRINHNVGNL